MMSKAYRPMLATLIKEPFDDKGWLFETKWDGFRLIAEIAARKVTLYSRNGVDMTARYPVIVAALRRVRAPCVLDGELVALDRRGRSKFQLLQNAQNKPANLYLYVFDILFLKGKDMRNVPQLERKQLLRPLVPPSSRVRYSTHVQEKGISCFEQAKKRGFEGIIAKRAAGRYHSGRRTREWLKIKAVHQQEAVIVGFTKPRGARSHFGSLVLAVRDGKKWKYVGRVGTGFDRSSLASLYPTMRPLVTKRKPVDGRVPDERSTTWIRPKLVAEVAFTEWTRGTEMRHPVFLGLRSDKKPGDVLIEKP